MTRHIWFYGASATSRRARVESLDLPARLVPEINAHRRLRGPYTAAGTLLRAFVPEVLERDPDLVQRHDIEILSTAPELRATVAASRETLTSLAVPEERTRFYSRMRTLRIAHGLADFLSAALVGRDAVSLVLEHVDQADPTDLELVSVLLRRVDPERLRLVVCTGSDDIPEPLATALADFCDRVCVEAGDESSTTYTAVHDAAAAYVAGDCTDDDPTFRRAYEELDVSSRRAWHDARLEELEALAETSLTLGAIPFHAEQGSDPAGRGADALHAALDYCIDLGYYDATVDFGVRGRAVIEWSDQLDHWWAFTTKMTTSLAALSRAAEAEVLYNEARAFSREARIHMQAAYATAMLYTRHFDDEHKDDQIAKGWINEAIAIASLLPDPKERAFQSVFHCNGLALIEVHLRNLPAALELVDGGLARLAAELGDSEHLLHRSVLLYNRGQVYAGMGRVDDALADYTAVIDADPNYAEYYLDRGNLLRRAGRDDEALLDYEHAIRLSPPFPEVYYNRGDVRREQGDIDGALSDYAYVLDLDPEFLDVYINRAGLLLALDDVDGARRDTEAGLAIDPDNPHLLCVLGQLAAADGDRLLARASYDRAIALKPDLAVAYANRALLVFDEGDLEEAIADLTAALSSGDDAMLRFNRATAYLAAGQPVEALEDLRRADELEPNDPDIVAGLEECGRQLTPDG